MTPIEITPICTKGDCFNPGVYDSIYGEGILCHTHAALEGDQLVIEANRD